MMLNVVGSFFGDKIDLNGRLNFVSSGNFYGATTVDLAAPASTTSEAAGYMSGVAAAAFAVAPASTTAAAAVSASRSSSTRDLGPSSGERKAPNSHALQ